MFLLFRIFTGIVALAFAVTTFCFLFYERLVTRRENTKNAALQIVASLFPAGVQDKVLKGAQDDKEGNVIAAFFPATTVLFGTFVVLLICVFLFCFFFRPIGDIDDLYLAVY